MSEVMGDIYKYDPNYHRFAEYLGIDRYDREDYDIAQKIAYIRDFLDSKKKLSESQALQALSHLRKGLGIPFEGKSLVKELYQHTRLESDRVKNLPPEPEKKKVVKKKEEKPGEKIDVKQIVKEAVRGAIRGALEKEKKTEQKVAETSQKSSPPQPQRPPQPVHQFTPYLPQGGYYGQ